MTSVFSPETEPLLRLQSQAAEMKPAAPAEWQLFKYRLRGCLEAGEGQSHLSVALLLLFLAGGLSQV